MPQYCCVPACTNKKGGHSFPSDKELRKKWQVAINRLDPKTKKLREPGKCDVVCRDHFRTEDHKESLLGNSNLFGPISSQPIFNLTETLDKCMVFKQIAVLRTV